MRTPRIKQSVAAMAGDVDRTSHKIDQLIAKIDQLITVILEHGISIGAEVAGHELPGAITVKPNDVVTQ